MMILDYKGEGRRGDGQESGKSDYIQNKWMLLTM